jgi:glycerophosphoryl diester phosphodiesterase
MPEFVFRFGPDVAGRAVKVYDQSGQLAHSGTAGSAVAGEVEYTATLSSGIYTGEVQTVAGPVRALGVLDATSAELSASYAAAPVSVDDLLDLSSFVVAHRGGGVNVAPDGTLEAMQIAHEAGAEVIEADTVRLADGAIGVMHDSTVDRTTSATGTCEDYSQAQWRQLTVDPSAWATPFPNWGNLKAPTWSDVVARLGGKTILAPEAKGSTSALAIDAATRIAKIARDAGIQRSTIVCSFNFGAVQAGIAGGCEGMYVNSDGLGKTPAELLAAGIRMLNVDWAVASQATISAHVAAGIAVIPWTLNTQYDTDTALALGCKGVLSDDPIYAARKYDTYRRTVAPWTVNNTFFHGHQAWAARGTFVSGTGGYWFSPGSSGTYLLGSMSPVANAASTYTITVPMHLVTTGADATQWSGVYFGSTRDTPFVGDVYDGYLVAMRQNGTLQLWRRATGGGSFASQGTVATAALSAGAKPVVTIAVTPTTVTVTRTDVAEPNSIAITNSEIRGGYVYLRDNGQNSGGRESRYGAIAIT